MKLVIRDSLVLLLVIIVVAESIMIHAGLSEINALREEKVSAARNSYKKTRVELEEYKALQGQYGGNAGKTPSELNLSYFTELARKAGVTSTPRVNERQTRSANKALSEYSYEIKLYGVASAPLYAFLKSIDDIGGMTRIKTVMVNKTRGKTNKFDMTISFSSFTAG